MKQIYYVNPDLSAITTIISGALEYGTTVITVADSSNFSSGDFVLLEAQGNEYNELLKISSVDSSTQMTLTTSIQYPHVTGIVLTKLDYDTYKIEKSTDGTTYTTLTTGNLNYSNKFNRIEYYDDIGSDSYYYKIYYVNSQTLTEELQDTLNNEDNFSWITQSKFMAESGLNASYSSYVTEALMFGVESMRDDLFFNKILSTTDSDVKFDLNLEGYYLADQDGNREINKDDIVIYEFDVENNLRTYLNHKVVKIFVDNPKVIFKETVPTSGSILYMEIPVAQVKYSDYKRSYEKINKLYAISYLLGDKVPSVVKNAVLDWTAGGTSVSKNPGAVHDAIENVNKEIQTLMKDLMLKTYIGKTKLRTKTSSLNAKMPTGSYANNSVLSPAGNVYRF